MKQYKCSMSKKIESLGKKNERGTTKIETYVGFDELLGYADAEYLLEDVVDVLSKYYTYEGEGDDIVFDEDQAKGDPEFSIKIEGGDERADFYSEDIFYVHLPNKEAAEELAKVLGGELNESKKPESCKDGKKESMERCDSCGAVMTEYDYDRYGGLCKRCRDKGEAKKSEALTKDTTVVGQIDNSSLKWIERTLGQIKKKFPDVEADSRGNTITIRGKLADVSAVCDAYPKGISHLHQDKGGDFLPNAAGDDLDYGEVDKVLSESKKSESKKSEDASSVDDLLARHNQKWLVKVSYDVDASHSAVAPSIVRADTKDAATNIALKRHRGLGYNMKVVSVEPMTESRKKSEGATGIGDTMYASKLKSLARKLGSFGFKVSDTVEVKDENANDKSAEYNLSAEKDGKSYKINVDIYEGKHTTITLRDGATNAYISHLGEGSSFASAVSAIDADSVKSESKKSEGIGNFLDAKIDYNMFMRMCKTAAYLEEDEDYWDALWDFYSEVGSIGDALVFFDNLFQYTAWMDVDETYDELAESDQDGSKSKEECIEAVLDRDGEIRGSLVRNYGDHYLWVY